MAGPGNIASTPEVEVHDVRSPVNMVAIGPPHEVRALVGVGRRDDDEVDGLEPCQSTRQVEAEGPVGDNVLGAHDRLIGNWQW